jgi:drug/metabolite transporter (DMT)-like permease
VTPLCRASRTALIASAVVLALAPFGVAALRVVRTGNDVRYLWVALASFVGAVGVALIGRARARTRAIVGQRAVVVCIVFALFFAASTTLYALSRA